MTIKSPEELAMLSNKELANLKLEIIDKLTISEIGSEEHRTFYNINVELNKKIIERFIKNEI